MVRVVCQPICCAEPTQILKLLEASIADEDPDYCSCNAWNAENERGKSKDVARGESCSVFSQSCNDNICHYFLLIVL